MVHLGLMGAQLESLRGKLSSSNWELLHLINWALYVLLIVLIASSASLTFDEEHSSAPVCVDWAKQHLVLAKINHVICFS